MMQSLGSACALMLLGAESGQPKDANALSSLTGIKRITLPGLQNTFRVTDRIYSGSQPANEAGFEALAQLGVKTIVNVDGSKPNAAMALKYGLHYVHLPFGYDGVPTNRVAELAQAIRTKPGPFYVHCHHGFHRGPTAVAIICEANEKWTSKEAIDWLQVAGTSREYPGLYQSVAGFKPPTQAELVQAVNLPEIAQSSSLVDSMVALDEHFSSLKLSQKAGWSPPPGQPDMSPSHEALMLAEIFHELPRTVDLGNRPEDFREKMSVAEEAAHRLRAALSKEVKESKANDVLEGLAQSCAACHRAYRNHKTGSK